MSTWPCKFLYFCAKTSCITSSTTRKNGQCQYLYNGCPCRLIIFATTSGKQPLYRPQPTIYPAQNGGVIVDAAGDLGIKALWNAREPSEPFPDASLYRNQMIKSA